VWFPDREKYIGILTSLQETLPYIKTDKHVILDLRPEGSHYELDMDPTDVAEDLAFEREDREFAKEYEKLKKDMEEKKFERNRERERLREEKRKERERRELNATNIHHNS
jgi:hypothetical protein